MTKIATMASGANVGATSAWYSTAASGPDGVKARKKFSLPALVNMLSEASVALEEAGGALMEIDDSTLEDIPTLMARHKYV